MQTTISFTGSHQQPCKASQDAAGFDICAKISGVVAKGERRLVPTGLFIAIERGYSGRLASRSGLACKHGVVFEAGIIDSDYRGEVKVLLYNHGEKDFIYEAADLSRS